MSNGASISAMLDNLAEKQEQHALIENGRRRTLESVVPAEVVIKLDQVNQHFDEKIASLDAEIAELEAAIKPLVIEQCTSVKGMRKHAVLTPPKPKVEYPGDVVVYAKAHPAVEAYINRVIVIDVDAAGLERYTKTDPEVKTFITYTEAKVTIRDVK